MVPVGFGVAWMAQVLPSQCSASVFVRLPVPVYCPVAAQLVAEVQETAASWSADDPSLLGVGWIAHVLPFQDSANVAVPEAVL